MRDAVLLESSRPILFVQGTRDSLCPLDLLEGVRGKMKAAESSFTSSKAETIRWWLTKTQLRAAGETQDQVEERILGKIREFVTNRET